MKLNELYENSWYANEHGMLFNMDCVECMRQIEDNTIDLTVTSPPYDLMTTLENIKVFLLILKMLQKNCIVLQK